MKLIASNEDGRYILALAEGETVSVRIGARQYEITHTLPEILHEGTANVSRYDGKNNWTLLDHGRADDGEAPWI